MAMHGGSKEIVELIISKRADINVKDSIQQNKILNFLINLI